MPDSPYTPEISQKEPALGALVTLFLAPAFIFANMYTTQAILPVLSLDFHISAPAAGLTVSLLVLAVAFGSLVYGPLSDRIGRKKVMVGASFLVIIPTLLSGFAPNFAILVLLRAMQGLLMPGLTSVAIPYVYEEFEGKGRGLAMGIYVCGLTLGGLFARVGSAALTGFFNWRIALEAFALPTLIAALIMWKFLPETSKNTLSSANIRRGSFFRQSIHDMSLHLRNRRLVGAFIIGFTLFFGFIGAFTYLPYYLTGTTFNLPTIALSLVYLLWLTGVFAPLAGSVAGRIGSRRAIAFSMGLAAIGLLITLIPILPVVLFGLGLLALGMFSTVPAVNLYLGEQAATAKGTAASMYLSLYYFGGSFGAVLPGFALLWAGWPGVAILCLGMVLIALASDALLCR
ncbi:MAG TPA: MFS transporter [Ktedonobacteraceae bacterium]|nr:MFS transporter [Ktedonobacteraceae bacterium]